MVEGGQRGGRKTLIFLSWTHRSDGRCLKADRRKGAGGESRHCWSVVMDRKQMVRPGLTCHSSPAKSVQSTLNTLQSVLGVEIQPESLSLCTLQWFPPDKLSWNLSHGNFSHKTFQLLYNERGKVYFSLETLNVVGCSEIAWRAARRSRWYHHILPGH